MKSVVLAIALLAVAVSANCPNACSGHGRCGEWSKCTCFWRWTGNDCSQRLCKEGLAWVDGSQADPHSWAECSNKGICNRESGECECYDQYDGAACERSVCPNDCNGHGTCEYIQELSTYASTNWDHNKIQGCKCDGDWTGTDCSQRICAWGDDPITIPLQDSGLTGDLWNITIATNGSIIESLDINLEVVDLNGVTHRSRPFKHATEAGVTLLSPAEFEYLLEDIPVIFDVTDVEIHDAGHSAGAIWYAFRLIDPLRVTEIRVDYKSDCTEAGCYPLRAPMVPADGEDMLIVNAFVESGADPLAESAECSNRGLCNYDNGLCECFEGFYGLACQHQTILV